MSASVLHKSDLGFQAIGQGSSAQVARRLGGDTQALQGVQQPALRVVHTADPSRGGRGTAGGFVGGGDVRHVDVPPVEVGQTYPLPLGGSCPKKGKSLHPTDYSSAPFKLLMADALQRATANKRNKAKAVMTATGCAERTAKNWLAGSTEPCGEDLIALMRAFDDVARLILTRAGLDPSLVKLRALKALLEE